MSTIILSGKCCLTMIIIARIFFYLFHNYCFCHSLSSPLDCFKLKINSVKMTLNNVSFLKLKVTISKFQLVAYKIPWWRTSEHWDGFINQSWQTKCTFFLLQLMNQSLQSKSFKHQEWNYRKFFGSSPSTVTNSLFFKTLGLQLIFKFTAPLIVRH